MFETCKVLVTTTNWFTDKKRLMTLLLCFAMFERRQTQRQTWKHVFGATVQQRTLWKKASARQDTKSCKSSLLTGKNTALLVVKFPANCWEWTQHLHYCTLSCSAVWFLFSHNGRLCWSVLLFSVPLSTLNFRRPNNTLTWRRPARRTQLEQQVPTHHQVH